MLKTVSSIVNAIGALNYKGTWDANANSPTLTSSVGTKGDYYVVSVAGNTNLNGITTWGVGDWAVFNGSVWQRVEGGADGNFVNITWTGTATGGSIVPRVVAIADGTSVTINADITDMATQANTQVAGTLTINAPTGTPVAGQKLIFRLQSTNQQTFSWNGIFQGSNDASLPSLSTGGGKYDYMGFMYNAIALKWQMVAKNFGF